MLRFSAALALALTTAAAAQTAPDAAAVNARLAAPLPADQAAMKAHVLFLASDAMRGREAGSPEYDIAAQYVAAQFYAAGLRPGGDEGGYLQRVPLVRFKPATEGSVTWTPSGRQAQTLAFGTDYIPVANPRAAETRLSAPVVFVGYGIEAPELGHDDYRNVDVRGKIIAFVTGAPSLGNSEVEASFTRDTRMLAAARHGAVGAIAVSGAALGAAKEAMSRTVMTWATPTGTGGGAGRGGVPLLAALSSQGATKLFGKAWARVEAMSKATRPRYKPLMATGELSIRTDTVFTPAASSNVIGVFPGSDPMLKNEVVVLSAHLDHIGVRAEGEGDRINNGALDNALGIASLIEEAKRFTASGVPPKRTILFLAVTGEEKGLVGSGYFVEHPTVPLDRIVADVNLDMPILTYRFEDMIVYGADRTTLGPIVRRAVESAGVTMSPDPMPEQGIFVRSDHFRFVQKGIPAVFLWPGQKGPGKAAVAAFMGRCYHRPCDEVAQQPILWDQGVRFVDVNYRIAREIADGPARPVWNRGDYFGTLYRGPMAR